MSRRLTIYLMSLMMLTSSALILMTGDSTGSPPAVFQLPSTAWNGQVAILPDGSLSNANAPIEFVGNHYDLIGNINGSLTVELNGAIVNGNGYTVWNTVGISPVQVSDADGVSMENLTVASWYASGISIVSSSYDMISNNTVYAMVCGIYVFSPFNSIVGNVVNVSLRDPGYSGQSCGITVKGSYSNLTDNTVLMQERGYGIYLEAGESMVQNNLVSFSPKSAEGIVVDGTHNVITSNNIQGSGTESTGVDLVLGSQFTKVLENAIDLSGQRTSGIMIQDGLNTVEGNAVTTEGTYSHAVDILSSGTGTNMITGNTVNATGQNSIGIYDTSQGILIEDNSVIVQGAYGRGITSTNVPQIVFNDVNVTGDYVYGISTPNGNVECNTVTVSGSYAYGIYSTGGQSVWIQDNVINSTGDHAYGVVLNGQFHTLTGNLIEAGYNNGTGLMMNSLVDSVISNNSILFTKTGIQGSTYSSYGLTFQGNYLMNDTVAFKVVGISSNLFFHNSFINYTSFDIIGSGSAAWDNGYPAGGNFWSPYNGTDLYSGPSQNISGSDGIGDIPFVLAANNVDHYPLMTPWSIPSVQFTESGLAEGTQWSAMFSGLQKTSNSSTISFPISFAIYCLYDYSIAEVEGYTHNPIEGSVQFAGSTVTVSVVFQPIPESSYNVEFTQTGLPAGTEWEVTLDNVTLKSTSTSILFDPVNGTYNYTIGSLSGYSAGSSSGTVTVDGDDLLVPIAFTQVLHHVEFSTKGLPSGMTWYVNLSNGQSYSSTSSIIDMQLSNGTYTYSVDNVSNYNSTPATGHFSVSGDSPAPIQITFEFNSSVPEVVAGHGIPYIWYFIAGIAIGGLIVGAVIITWEYLKKK